MAFDIPVKVHPDLQQFTLTDQGHIGWARKIGYTPAMWSPDGIACGSSAGSWRETYDGVALTWEVPRKQGVFIETRGSSVRIRSTTTDRMW